jgi:hypothetical protein
MFVLEVHGYVQQPTEDFAAVEVAGVTGHSMP